MIHLIGLSFENPHQAHHWNAHAYSVTKNPMLQMAGLRETANSNKRASNRGRVAGRVSKRGRVREGGRERDGDQEEQAA